MAQSSGSRINTNVGALNALNALNDVNRQLGVHQLRLATGKRINSSQDDAAGYVISKKMDGRIRALTAALDNIGDAQNIYSVAEGGYSSIANLLTQIKEKQARFVNGSMGVDEKTAIVAEVNQLMQEIGDTATRTSYNAISLLDGNFAGVAQLASAGGLVVGASSATTGTVTAITVSGAKASDTFTLAAGTAANQIKLTDSSGVSQELTVAATVIGTEQTFNFSQLNVSIKFMGIAVAADTAVRTAILSLGSGIRTDAGTASAFQVGDTGDNFNMTFGAAVSAASLLGNGGVATTVNMGLLTVDAGMQTVLTALGDIGANMNRLSVKESNLTTSITNIIAAQSRIQDADIAKEQISAVKLQILQQTSTAQLAAANQSPQVFLSLFR